MRQRRSNFSLRHEINVTPLVDVLLVLLVVFMVAAPMMQSGVPVDLPQGRSDKTADVSAAPFYITLDKEGQIFIQDKMVDQTELLRTLQTLPPKTAERICLRADRSLSHGQIMQFLDFLSTHNFKQVMFVMEKAS